MNYAFKIRMESDKDLNLEAPIPTGPNIITRECIKLASWLINHKDEISRLIKKGWTDPRKIVDYLRRKHNK